MKIIRDIVWSSDEPLDKNVLWLNNGLIKYYGPNGWESLKYFSMLEDNIVGSIDAETHKIALSGSLPQMIILNPNFGFQITEVQDWEILHFIFFIPEKHYSGD